MNNKAVDKTEHKQEEKLVFDFYKDMSVTIKNVKNSENYKDIFPDYFCAKKFFGTNIPKPDQNSYHSDSAYFEAGNGDFLEKIANTEKGCFNMKTQETDGFIVGFSEFAATSTDSGIVIQSEFNLKKDDESSYFWTKLSFFKKQGGSWELDRVLALDEGEEIKKYESNEIIDSPPKTILQIWSKSNNGSGSENLFQKFYFKKDLKFWKDDMKWISLDFENAKFLYTENKWYKLGGKSSIVSAALSVANIKGKWSENLVNLCEKNDSQYGEYCTKSKEQK